MKATGTRPPRHPVTVRVSLATGAIIVQGLDEQIVELLARLAVQGMEVVVDSHGLCG